MRKLLYAGVASLALLGSAHATVISNLDIISSATIGNGTLGTVSLTQRGADEVDVAVELAAGTYFVSTGGPHDAFVFNLGLTTAYTVAIISPAGGIFALAGADQDNTPFGFFTYGIDCPGCGPGASHANAGPLYFKVTDASGFSVDDFIANNGGYFFSADVIGPGGGTGNIAANVVTDPPDPVPEPGSSLVLLGSGLLGLGAIRCRKPRLSAISARRINGGFTPWSRDSVLRASGRYLKRAADLTVACGLLAFTMPVMMVVALAIKCDSAGPVFYRQERVGLGGRRFTLLKFRSMRQDAEADGRPVWAAADDDRITRVGRFIRCTRVDELPQLFNVFHGEMSMVGPRPERPYFVDQLSAVIPSYHDRYTVLPGITGWAQINYPYGASIEDAWQKLRYDLDYVANHGLLLDLKILVATVGVVVGRKGAR